MPENRLSWGSASVDSFGGRARFFTDRLPKPATLQEIVKTRIGSNWIEVRIYVQAGQSGIMPLVIVLKQGEYQVLFPGLGIASCRFKDGAVSLVRLGFCAKNSWQTRSLISKLNR